MPGIIPPGGGAGTGNAAADPHVFFVNEVAKQTGFDPRVIYAWTQTEGAYAPNGTGHYNFLNLRPYQGDPYSGVSSGGFEQFSNVNDAITATVRRINQPFFRGALSAANSGSPPAQQISAIAATGWDAGHYTKDGRQGKGLLDAFASLYGNAALGSPSQSQPLPTAGGGASGGQTNIGTTLGGLFPGWLTDPGPWLLRGIEILAGGVLVILGLYLLAKQVGLGGVDVPDALNPAARQADAAAAAVQAQKIAEQTRARERTEERHQATLSVAKERARTQREKTLDVRYRRPTRTQASERRQMEATATRRAAATAARKRQRDAAYGDVPF